jgi:aldose 1-epimerase
MNFSILTTTENGLDIVILKNEKSGTEVAVLPAYGAMLHSFKIKHKDSFFNVIDNYNGDAHLKKELSATFKSSKLSPFPCRIPEGKYVYNNTPYEFQQKFQDGSAIHGLLYNKLFEITAKNADDNKASVTLQYEYKKNDAGYPFHYTCIVEYALTANDYLQVTTTISNNGNETIPLADGWHPYFQLGGKVNDWTIQFNAESIVEFNDKLIPTGKLLPYNKFNSAKQLGEMELDNCFVLQKNYKGAACTIVNPGNGLHVSLFPDDSYPYLQIYTPPHRTSIAIENLSAAPDCFNNKMGLLLLHAGHSQTFTVGYQTGTTEK